MATLRLSAETRSDTGKGAAKKMRRAGRIPAILYGRGQEGVSLSLGNKEVSHLLANPGAMTNVLELEITDSGKSSKKNILVKKIQKHPFREEVLHMDLLEIALDQKISVMVPIELAGESEGVKMGGILEMKRRELEITSLPNQIPDTIVIDITELQIGDAVHVEDITPPDGAQISFESNFTVLSVVAPAAEIEEEEAEEEEAEGEAAPGEEAAPEKKEEEGGEE